jgi:hypothetical protein
MSSENPDPLSVEAAGALRALADYVEKGGRCRGYIVAITKDVKEDSGDRIVIGGSPDVIQGLLDVTKGFLEFTQSKMTPPAETSPNNPL